MLSDASWFVRAELVANYTGLIGTAYQETGLIIPHVSIGVDHDSDVTVGLVTAVDSPHDIIIQTPRRWSRDVDLAATTAFAPPLARSNTRLKR